MDLRNSWALGHWRFAQKESGVSPKLGSSVRKQRKELVAERSAFTYELLKLARGQAVLIMGKLAHLISVSPTKNCPRPSKPSHSVGSRPTHSTKLAKRHTITTRYRVMTGV